MAASLRLAVVTSQNPVSYTIGRQKLHHLFCRICRAFAEATGTEELSRSSRLYKEQVGAGQIRFDPLITENETPQVK